MAYAVVSTAVTGDVVPAAWGNRVRDNSAYLHGDAGPIALVNALSTTGAITAPGFNTSGATAGLNFNDRADSTSWVWYASAGLARLFSAAVGDVLSVEYANGNLHLRDQIDNAIVPGHLSHAALTGFLRGGQWTYNYNGDGTINWHVMNAAGPLNGVTVTYEYSAGLISAIRLRPTGGAAGTITQSIVFTYDGSGRIATEAHS